MSDCDEDLLCHFGRCLRAALGRDEPSYEYALRVEYFEQQTRVLVSWVGDAQEVPEWLQHVDYVAERRWERHFLFARLPGKVTGLSFFEHVEVADLARQYCTARYGAQR